MLSRFGPKRKLTWAGSSPMLLASLSIHALALFVLLLILGNGPSGSGTWGAARSDAFSATWSRGAEGGQGRQIDTVVPDAEPAGSVGLLNTIEVQPAAKSSPLLEVIQKDPQSVFDADSDGVSRQQIVSTISPRSESVLDEMESTETVQPKTDDLVTDSRKMAHTAMGSGRGNAMSADGAGEDQSGSGDGHSNAGHDRGDHGSSKGDGNRIEFFGIVAKGRRVVYVIDASESMRQHNAMELARQKLASSLQDLSLTSQFQILFFNLTTHAMNQSGDRLRLLAATSINLRLAKQFVNSIQPDSGTDRFAALKAALALEPDVVYLLTDADDPPLSAKDLWTIRRSNKRNSVVHVVEFGVGGDISQDSFLKTLARQNGGTHRYYDLTRPGR